MSNGVIHQRQIKARTPFLRGFLVGWALVGWMTAEVGVSPPLGVVGVAILTVGAVEGWWGAGCLFFFLNIATCAYCDGNRLFYRTLATITLLSVLIYIRVCGN